jgi:hypothetical protein
MAKAQTTWKSGPYSFTRGQTYSKKALGINDHRYSVHIISGKTSHFFIMGGTFANEVHLNSFVYETRNDYERVPPNLTQEASALAFINTGDPYKYKYLGEAHSVKRHDEKRNKLLWS